ncbi:MAG: ABC transporter ATP-binding protein, partial [Tissierellia bacterium]|nr:ABC transporter ATP-binding protein [Tissierellia bacterium]
MKSILNVKNVEKYYGNKDNVTKALDSISFSIDKGEFIGIMGPSGSGKTTLLNCISTIDKVTTGSIEIDREDITRLKGKKLDRFRMNKLGFIFQDLNLLDTLTAYENISLALTIGGMRGKEIRPLIEKSAENLGISEVLDKYPYEMSGGQKQRVAAARAIVTNPSLILADEPTGALDSKSSKMLLNSIEKLNKELEATILMVTHDAFTA